jgi:predicted membrane chloride channel (bestrophin family)
MSRLNLHVQARTLWGGLINNCRNVVRHEQAENSA